MIEVMNLSKCYGEKKALSDVSFSVANGEVVGLIGKNGAGKSTILKSIAGLLHFDAGKILYDGIDCSESPHVIKDFGILIECAFLDYINAYDNLKLLYNVDERNDLKKADEKISEVFTLVGLDKVKYKRVKSYSFGMKQRLGLAQAMLTSKTFMMLDEPFIGLDPVGKEIVKKAIVKKAKEENYAILFSSHDLEDVAEICDRIIMIDNGICVYDDVINRLKKYSITIKLNTNVSVDTLRKEALKIGKNIEVSDTELVFTDSRDTDTLQKVLELLVSSCTINEISVTDNMLTEMFEKEKVE